MFEGDKTNKILCYLNTIKECEEFTELCRKYLCVQVYTSNGNNSLIHRLYVLEEFKRANTAVFVSARILGEGVDMPYVDSVCFVDPRFSKIDIIQCIGRGQRLYKNKKFCNVIIPVFEQFNTIRNVISGIYKISGNARKNMIMRNYKAKEENYLSIDEKILGEFRIVFAKKDGVLLALKEFWEKFNRKPQWKEKYTFEGLEYCFTEILRNPERIKDIIPDLYKLIVETKKTCKINPEKLINALITFYEVNKRVPKCRETFVYENENYNVGIKFNNLCNKKCKTVVPNENLMKIVEKKRQKEKRNPEKSTNALIGFFKKNKRVPKINEIFIYENENYNVGTKFNALCKKNCKIIIPDEELMNIIEKKRQKRNVKNSEKSINALIKFYKKNKRVPRQTEVFICENENYNVGTKFYRLCKKDSKTIIPDEELMKIINEQRSKKNKD